MQGPENTADTSAAIKALISSTPHDCERVTLTKVAMDRLIRSGWEVVYQWVPSHCGIKGNEMADQLAKQGASLPQPQQHNTFNQVKIKICSSVPYMKRRRQERSANAF